MHKINPELDSRAPGVALRPVSDPIYTSKKK
jgi:hypothetical protein